MSTDRLLLRVLRASGVAALLSGVAVLSAWAQTPSTARAPAAAPAAAAPRPAVSAAVPASGSIRVLVLPAGETVLASPVPGRIAKLHVGLGMAFRQGDVLVSMDCDESRARLAMAQADQASATDQYEAKLRMQGLDQASDVEVALAASAVAKTKAQVELYKVQIAQCSIRAPWDGRMAKLHVHSYMTVNAGQPLLDLVRSGLLLMKLNVPSSWIPALKIGQGFEVTIDETGKTYPAVVRRINGRVDPVSQTIELEASMTRFHPDLLPGMSGVAKFTGLR